MWKKCEKSVKNVENVEKQENTVFNTFPNLNLKKDIHCEPIGMNH